MLEPWRRDIDEVVARLETDVERGLSTAEAAKRLKRSGPNELEAAPQPPWWRRLLAQFADPLIYLLLAAVVVSIVVWIVEGAEGVPYEAIVIAVIVILNGLLGFVQEARAERAVAALQRLAAATATVRRDGREQRIPTTDVVPGDALVLGEGDAVAADGRLVEATSLTVAEASLTGESEPVVKTVDRLDRDLALGDRANMVFHGTAVTRGHGVAVITGTGMNTEMGNVARLLGRTPKEDTPLKREVSYIGRTLGIAVIAIAAVIVATILLTAEIERGSDVVDVLLVGVALAVAAVPEGLPAILAVVLALGVQRMVRRHAIVKKLASVETLGSASVICSDKTGTLTRNEMTIQKVVTGMGEVDITGVGYRPVGELRVDGKPLDDRALEDAVRAVIGGGSLANNAALEQVDGEWRIQGDPTEAAFIAASEKLPGLSEELGRRFERVGEIPFTSERKLMSVFEVDAEREGRLSIVTKGAPDVLIGRCAAERVGDEVRPLTDERRDEILREVDRLAGLALRTLAVAYRPLPDAVEPGDDRAERDLIYLGMVGIIDPPRSEVRDSIAEARAAGIRVVMITGDHPRTALRIASDLGIVEADARVITGSEIGDLDDRALDAAVGEVSVYARVAPEHKLRIVDALQAQGQIVAMTGDGVNDAPALKSADIGVAMGITGTDVTKEAADMILTDDNFTTIVAAVREGRAIFANIRRFLRFLLSSNVGEVMTMLFGVVLAGIIGLTATGEALAVPLLATQILWINLLTDSAPALALGVDPPPGDVMRRPPRRLGDRIIDREMWKGILWIGSIMAIVTLVALDLNLDGGLLGGTGDVDTARTVAFTTLVLAQLFNAFNARSDRITAFRGLFKNLHLWAAVAVSVALQIAVVHLPVMNDAFGTVPLSFADWAICLGLASIVLWAEELRKLLAA